MQFNLLDLADMRDYSGKKVLVPLSGGINSAAALCVLGEFHADGMKPAELHLFYSHLKEHSPETFAFVADCVRYAHRRFRDVRFKLTRASVNQFFLRQRMIPHPTLSPCSIELKIRPREAYIKQHGIDFVLVGFVKHEVTRRWKRQQRYNDGRTLYPCLRMTDEDCFSLVKQVIGWYPPIYDISEKGKRVFTHNNCLPCKNMTAKQLASVGRHYPDYALRAQDTAAQIPGAYWGRDDVPDVFQCDACTRFS